MQNNYQGYRLLLVHAHPDDETINNGATIAMYADLGAEITLVTCTRGEEGEVLIKELQHLIASQTNTLGAYRVQELAAAMKELGVTDHRFLGEGMRIYRDSGMSGSETNKNTEVFCQADIELASDDLVKVIDEVKPHVLITYDEFGGYGHPDHIQTHKVTMRATEKSKWKIPKIYWNVIPKSILQNGIETWRNEGLNFQSVEKVEDFPFAKEDSYVDAIVDATPYAERKKMAMLAHATQISVDGRFFALSDDIGVKIFGVEYYTLIKGIKSAPFNNNNQELDLFAGIKL
jgi:N-acetyl-1-D-myo-inositol-2-amino-2-deoxy-alpha-D-glucopyranoside deacetylase